MIRGMGTRALANIGIIALTLFAALWPQITWAQLSDAPTNVTCEAGQSLWVYELGTRGAAASPDSGATLKSVASLDIWTLADQSVTTGALSGFPSDIVSGRLFERFTPKSGTPTIQIGDFSATWPSAEMAGATQTGNVTPVAAANAIGNVSDIDISSVYSGEGSGNLLDFLKSDARTGGLTYFINSAAQFEYLRLALCSNVPPKAAEPEAQTDEPEPLEIVPTPRLKPDVTPEAGAQVTIAASSQTLASEGESLETGSSPSPEENGGVVTPDTQSPEIKSGVETDVKSEGVSKFVVAALVLLAGLAVLGLGYALKSGTLFSRGAPLRPSPQVLPNVNSATPKSGPNTIPDDPAIAAQLAAAAAAAALASQTVNLFQPRLKTPGEGGKATRPDKSERQKSDIIGAGLETGLLFPRSPMHPMRPALPPSPPAVASMPAPPPVTAAPPIATPPPVVAPPLVQTGQLSASSLQTLSGPYEVLRPAYQATGRLGQSQDGPPTSNDFALGTGFLITPRHVMTARHVHGMWGHYLTGENCDGIEFMAELGSEESDYHPFDGAPPQLWEGLDIAVYTLAKPVTHRTPLPLINCETETLDGREIVIFGYPDTLKVNDKIAALVEPDAIFAVKRASQGHVFRHSSDDDVPYGVTTYISFDKRTVIDMPAICHNASTMTGNSGSPVLDAKTGALLGVHFSGKPKFAGKEDANLAMAIEQIIQQEANNNLNQSA